MPGWGDKMSAKNKLLEAFALVRSHFLWEKYSFGINIPDEELD